MKTKKSILKFKKFTIASIHKKFSVIGGTNTDPLSYQRKGCTSANLNSNNDC